MGRAGLEFPIAPLPTGYLSRLHPLLSKGRGLLAGHGAEQNEGEREKAGDFQWVAGALAAGNWLAVYLGR
jgi:hypothetical protein